jgi:hypothetical protein
VSRLLRRTLERLRAFLEGHCDPDDEPAAPGARVITYAAGRQTLVVSVRGEVDHLCPPGGPAAATVLGTGRTGWRELIAAQAGPGRRRVPR